MEHLLVFLGFGMLSVVFTYPLVLNAPGSVILARGGDVWLHLWDLWWVKQALVSLHATPYFTTYLYYPTGVSLYFHSLDIVNAVLSIPLQPLIGLVASFNLLLLLSVTLSGYAAYLLIFYLTKSRAASVVGAFVFAFSPVQSTSIDLGQLDQVTMQWLPLYLLFLIRSARERSFANVPIAAIFLVLASLATWYFSLSLVIATVCFVAYEVLSNRTMANLRKIMARVGAIAVIFVVLMSPLLIPMLAERAQGAQYMVPAFGTTVYNSADLTEFFLPGMGGALSTESHHGVNLALGYTPLLLGAIGAFTARRQSRFWLIVFVVLLVLALGPLLRVAGVQTQIPLPYYLLYNLPVAAISRQPLRFDAAAMLALGVMAAFGVVSLRSRLRLPASRLHLESGWPLAVLFCALILFEFNPLPRPVEALSVDPFYQMVANDKQQYAILEVPSLVVSRAMFDQTLHGKPIIGGYTSRHFPYPFADNTPGVRQLFLADPQGLSEDIFSPPMKDVAQDVLNYYGIRYVVFHKNGQPRDQLPAIRSAIQTLFKGEKPVYKDSEMAVYQVRPSGDKGVAITPGEGWYDAEKAADGSRWRWTNGNAAVNLYSLSASPATYELKLTANSFHGPRTIDLMLDGKQVGSASVGEGSTQLSFPLSLQPGQNVVQIVAREAPESPAKLGLGADERYLAVGFTGVQVVRSP